MKVIALFLGIALAYPASGALSRRTSLPLKRCSEDQFAASLPTTNRYIRKLFDHMVRSNASVFTEDLAPEQFCVGAEIQANPRAMADASQRAISIWTGLVRLAQSDAHVATVLGHEMAHITMRHRFLDATQVEKNRVAVQGRLQAVFFLELAMEHTEASRLRSEIRDLTEMELGPEATGNWEETEADQVGRQFYVRAGFPPSEFVWRYEEVVAGFVTADATAETARLRRETAFRACGWTSAFAIAEPRRGDQLYANPCWLIWHFSQGPSRDMPRDSYRLNLSGEPTLAQVKAEIERVERSPPPTAAARSFRRP